MKIICALLVLCIAASLLIAATPAPRRGRDWYTPIGYVPDSVADFVSADAFLDAGYLANKSADSVTCTFVDKTTACGGAACPFWPTITLTANTVQVINFNGIVVTGGARWSCSAASAVVGQVRGAYTK